MWRNRRFSFKDEDVGGMTVDVPIDISGVGGSVGSSVRRWLVWMDFGSGKMCFDLVSL
jgi:hypothetical protein